MINKCNLSKFQVFIYEYNEASRRWIRVEAVSTVTEAVHDIAFAPNIGRSYHVLVISISYFVLRASFLSYHAIMEELLELILDEVKE